MAQFRLSVQTIQRAVGRSVVAASAYRSGTRLIDDRLAMEFDFSRKAVEFETVLAPPSAPPQFLDRQSLWNAAEAADQRKDAVPAREVLLSLPHELTSDQRRALVVEFATEVLVKQGIIADIAVHRPGKEGDQRNFHAHILVTTRTVGRGGFGPKADEWRGPKVVRQWREAWADIQNAHLRRHLGPNAPQVSHLSLAGRGEDREPSVHLGPAATALERRSRGSERGDQNREIDAVNRARYEARRDYQEAADRLAKAAPQIDVPLKTLVAEAKAVRTRMIAERDGMIAERDRLIRPTVESIRTIEREVSEPAREARSLAKRELSKVQRRAAWVRSRRRTLVQWLRNPARLIWAKHAELNALARARATVQRAELELLVRTQWLSSRDGQSYIAKRREPQLKAAAEVATRRRTLERKIKRADKRIIGATGAYNDLRMAEILGRKELRVPAKVPDEIRFIREVGGPAGAAVREYPPEARSQALSRLLEEPSEALGRQPGRNFSPDL